MGDLRVVVGHFGAACVASMSPMDRLLGAGCQHAEVAERSFDREILRLALPAFGALLAEPLYVLADTAVVGHLGTSQLGGLAVASAVLLAAYSLCIFLAYGTTAAVARLLGAGDEREAAHLGAQGVWLAAIVGTGLALIGLITGHWLVSLFGANGAVATFALTYFRISLIGLPFLLVTLAGTGYLRGVQDTRTPLLVAVISSVVNLVLELVLVLGLHRGIGASAAATVVVQIAAGLAYLRAVFGPARRLGAPLAPHPPTLRSLARVGADLMIRTAALRAAFIGATVIATRLGKVEVAAHQICVEIWNLLALGLDALAIAAQAMVGRLLGAGRPDDARAASRRLLQVGMVAGVILAVLIAALAPVLPRVFTDDTPVRDLSAFVLLWVAGQQPVAAVVFVLDGVLIGAGDQRFLARAMVLAGGAFFAAALPILPLGLGIGWVWAAISVLLIARMAALGLRFAGDRWQVLGACR